MTKYVKKFIHWTDPNYLDAFYRAWGAGQSVTRRQAPHSEDQAETPQERSEPQQERDPQDPPTVEFVRS